MTPKASFVIPAYNAQSWIAESLQSCLDQSVEDIEAIVVNDASTDYTWETIERMAKNDNRIVAINLEQNGRASNARNVAIERASSDYILIQDADDNSTRHRVRDTLACFEKKNPDLVYGGYVIIDSLGNMEHRYLPQPFNKERSLKDNTHYICHSTMAFRKGVARNIRYKSGDFDRVGIEDWQFIWDAVHKGYKFAWIKSPLVYKRFLDGSTITKRNEEEILKIKKDYLANVI